MDKVELVGMAEAVEVEIHKIRRDPELQVRTVLDKETIEQYAEAMKAFAAFPPVIVYEEGDQLWLSQGFHRLAAAEAAGLIVVRAIVRSGSREDAQWDAIGSNKEHDTAGRRRTNADRQRAVTLALEARPDLSDREIAEYVGVDHKTVAKYRPQVTQNTNWGNSPVDTLGKNGKVRRVGSDGKVRRVPTRSSRGPEDLGVPGCHRVDLPTRVREPGDDLPGEGDELVSEESSEPAPAVETVVEPAAEETAPKSKGLDADQIKALPVYEQLDATSREVFLQDALDFYYFADIRKQLKDRSQNRFSKGRGKGLYAYIIKQFLRCEPPTEWSICTTPEDGGCNGVGNTQLGECTICHGHGYRVAGLYLNGSAK